MSCDSFKPLRKSEVLLTCNQEHRKFWEIQTWLFFLTKNYEQVWKEIDVGALWSLNSTEIPPCAPKALPHLPYTFLKSEQVTCKHRAPREFSLAEMKPCWSALSPPLRQVSSAPGSLVALALAWLCHRLVAHQSILNTNSANTCHCFTD